MYLRHFQVQVDVLEMENVLKWADHLFDQHILVKDFDYVTAAIFSWLGQAGPSPPHWRTHCQFQSTWMKLSFEDSNHWETQTILWCTFCCIFVAVFTQIWCFSQDYRKLCFVYVTLPQPVFVQFWTFYRD